jgi:hypothetical protein
MNVVKFDAVVSIAVFAASAMVACGGSDDDSRRLTRYQASGDDLAKNIPMEIAVVDISANNVVACETALPVVEDDGRFAYLVSAPASLTTKGVTYRLDVFKDLNQNGRCEFGIDGIDTSMTVAGGGQQNDYVLDPTSGAENQNEWGGVLFGNRSLSIRIGGLAENTLYYAVVEQNNQGGDERVVKRKFAPIDGAGTADIKLNGVGQPGKSYAIDVFETSSMESCNAAKVKRFRFDADSVDRPAKCEVGEIRRPTEPASVLISSLSFKTGVCGSF